MNFQNRRFDFTDFMNKKECQKSFDTPSFTVLFYSNSFKVFSIIPIASSNCSSLITKGGAKRMI